MPALTLCPGSSFVACAQQSLSVVPIILVLAAIAIGGIAALIALGRIPGGLERSPGETPRRDRRRTGPSSDLRRRR